MKKYNYDRTYHFPIKYIDNEKYILSKVKRARIFNRASREAYERILRFLYDSKFTTPIYRVTVRKYESTLTLSEFKIAFKLAYRASGKVRFRYGMSCALALKKAKYKCQVCGERDVRCLEIDHVKGRDKKRERKKKHFYKVKDFQCLCANHHRIKTEVEKNQN